MSSATAANDLGLATTKREVFPCARQITILSANTDSDLGYSEAADLFGFDYELKVEDHGVTSVVIESNSQGIEEIYIGQYSSGQPVASLLPGMNETRELLIDLAKTWVASYINVWQMRVRKLDDRYILEYPEVMPRTGKMYWRLKYNSKSLAYIKRKIHEATLNYHVVVDYHLEVPLAR